MFQDVAAHHTEGGVEGDDGGGSGVSAGGVVAADSVGPGTVLGSIYHGRVHCFWQCFRFLELYLAYLDIGGIFAAAGGGEFPLELREGAIELRLHVAFELGAGCVRREEALDDAGGL